MWPLLMMPFNTTRILRTPKHEGHGHTITSWTEVWPDP